MALLSPEAILYLVFGLLAAERLVELAINRRHVERLRREGARFTGNDGFQEILVVQVMLFLLVPLEFLFTPWATVGWWTWPLLGVALLAQALRYWVIRTLGYRWSVRVVTLPGAPRVTRGPYRFLRHPNYLAVTVELLALPLAFGCVASAAALTLGNALALSKRVRVEERALDEAEARARATGPRNPGA